MNNLDKGKERLYLITGDDADRGYLGRNDPIGKGFFKGFLSFISALLLLSGLLSGCSTTNTSVKTMTPSVAEEGNFVSIKEIRLGHKDGVETVDIVGSRQISYTAFKLTNPSRLIIDIPDAVFKDLNTPQIAGEGLVKAISTKLYKDEAGSIGRVEIGIDDDVDYRLELKGNVLNVVLKKVGSESMSEVNKKAEDAVSDDAIDVTAVPADTDSDGGQMYNQDTTPLTAGTDDGASVRDLRDAKRLLSIDVKKGNSYNVFTFHGDGRFSSYNTFTLDNPNRLVVDLLDVKSDVGGDEIGVGTGFAKGIRIGADDKRVRVVVDVVGKQFPPYRVVSNGDAIYVMLGDIKTAGDLLGIDVAEAGLGSGVDHRDHMGMKPLVKQVSAVSSQQPASMDGDVDGSNSFTNRVESVDFKKTETASLVIIKTTEPPDYTLTKSLDGKTIALIINNASISDELVRTLDTSEFRGEVESVSSYLSDKGRVTVLVRLRDVRIPEVSKKGNLVVMEFPEKMLKGQVYAKEVSTAPARSTGSSMQETKGVPSKVSAKMKEERVVKNTQSVDDSETKKYTGRKISLDVKDADIQNLFRLIAEVSNLNVVVSDKVKGKITLRLVDVPWDQALDIILKTKNLGMILDGNVMRIAPAQDIAKEEADRLKQKKNKEKLEDLVVQLVPVNYATASDLKAKIKDLLSERGSVTVDDRTNTLIIKDIQANIDDAMALVKKLDAPTPQVLIEARIVEAATTFARDLGVQWGVDAGTEGGKRSAAIFGDVGTTGLSTPTNLNLNSTLGTNNFAISLPATGEAGTLGAIGFTFGKLTGDPLLIDLKLSAGEVEGLTKTISKPRIITLDNTEAKISQGDSVPFETVSDSGTQTQFIDATLDLTVTPHITPDGSVIMKIKASRNAIGSFRSAVTGTPSISKKEASTEILVKDGETAVIGGIIVSDKSDNTSGLPALRKIPILGWLFKRNSVKDTQTELLIFITPKIVKEKPPVEG